MLLLLSAQHHKTHNENLKHEQYPYKAKQNQTEVHAATKDLFVNAIRFFCQTPTLIDVLSKHAQKHISMSWGSSQQRNSFADATNKRDKLMS